ncbi:MAG: dTDP-4-dehydrorhamnose reductase [Bacilli bacterium]|nr:dTDP-4-dehydrorhamnose reductase [Bacilli bacterium]
MRFLVTGVKGQLGYDVVRELKSRGYNDVLEYDIEQMDITDARQVEQCIVGNEPDVVIHCAAYTAVDKAEDEPELAEKINVAGTKNIAEMTELIGCKLIYISTDYVFDGRQPLSYIYDVDDKVNPQSVYGKTKYKGELAAKINPRCFIVRTSWVFGINGNNFVKTMLKLAETKDEINVVSDQYGSPTYTVDLAKLLVDMSLTYKFGTYHASNEGYISWAQFAEEIFKVNNIDVKVNHISTKEYPTKARRPHNSCLSKISLTNNGFERLPDYKDALIRYSKELKEQKENEKKLILK